MQNNYKKYFKIYLLTILTFAIIWLYLKHSVGNDSTISEWIINYQGGFTRRGLPGELAFQIAKFFDFKLRVVILFFQVTFYSLYLFLIYRFFKDIKLNAVILFAIFTPIFLLFHIAELEVLVRKEIFLFLGYLWFYNISNEKDDIKKTIFWILFILPIISILYEPSVFYYSFFAAIAIIKMRNLSLLKILIITSLLFIPSIIVSWMSATISITDQGFLLMKNSLLDNFNEACYRSCDIMNSMREPSVHLNQTFNKLNEGEYTVYSYLFRYLMIILIGFAPLFLIIKNTTLSFPIFNFKGFVFPFIIVNLTVPVHWLMFIDWGRAVNIAYVSALLFFFHLYKNKLIKINFPNINKEITKVTNFFIKNISLKSKKKFFVFVFIIYAFGWSPPTLLSADVNSFPGYRIPYKTIKFLSLNHLGYNIFYFYKN